MTYIPKIPNLMSGFVGLADLKRMVYSGTVNKEVVELQRREEEAWHGLQGGSLRRGHPSDIFFPFPNIESATCRIVVGTEKDIIDDLYNDLNIKGKLDVLEGQAWCDVDPKTLDNERSNVMWWVKCHCEMIDPDKINSLCDICGRKDCNDALKKLKKVNGKNYCSIFVKETKMTEEYIQKLEILIRLKKEVIFIPNQGKTEFNLVL